MVCGRLPFEHQNRSKLVRRIITGSYGYAPFPPLLVGTGSPTRGCPPLTSSLRWCVGLCAENLASYDSPSVASKACRDLIGALLTVDPESRATLPSLRLHPWIVRHRRAATTHMFTTPMMLIDSDDESDGRSYGDDGALPLRVCASGTVCGVPRSLLLPCYSYCCCTADA